MTQYADTFGADITGAQPAGWTERWDGANSAWTVQAAAEVQSGKLLLHAATANGKRLLSWDDIDADGGRADVEVLLKFKSSSTSGSQGLCAVRGSGAAGSETGYWVTFASAQIQLRKYAAGVDSSIASASFSFAAGTRYYCRVRANGTSLKVRVWAATAAAEPASWNIDTSDASISAAGWVGFAASTSTGNHDFDFISVGTGGDSAAMPASIVRTTQTAVLSLDAADGEIRTTQTAVLALEGGTVAEPIDIRTTQAAVLYLVADLPAVKVTQAALLSLVHETPCLQQVCQCWSITRADGTVLRYTTHDAAVTLQGETYGPCESLQATASSGGLVSGGVGDAQLIGMISDSGVTAADLLGGRYDGAVIEVWEGQWGDEERGMIPRRLAKGVIGKVRQADAAFTADLLSPGARLVQRPLLQPHTPACWYDLGGAGCPVDLPALTVAGAVTALEVRNNLHRSEYRVFRDTARVEADGYFGDGKIVWTSGDNTGLSSEVRTNLAGWVILWSPMPYRIAVGDAYTIAPGCNKSAADHKTKFGLDMTDFGGFPHLPGNDAMLDTPDAKV